MTNVLASLLLLAAMASSPAAAGDKVVQFDGGIGVIPVSNVNAAGLGTANTVNGVAPGGQPWVIAGLKAQIDASGHISVVGRGLLLAGGNGIGTNGGQSVMAILYCGGAAHKTGLVPLDAEGNFKIDDTLTPPLTSPMCDTPVLLIANGAQRWFAAGIVKFE